MTGPRLLTSTRHFYVHRDSLEMENDQKIDEGWVTLRRLHNDPRTMLGRLTMASFIEFLRSTNSFESQEFQNGFQWNIFAKGTSEASEMLQCKSEIQKNPQSSFSVTWTPQSSKSSRLPWSSCNKQKKRNNCHMTEHPPTDVLVKHLYLRPDCWSWCVK